jgi:hypothetical protein
MASVIKLFANVTAVRNVPELRVQNFQNTDEL